MEYPMIIDVEVEDSLGNELKELKAENLVGNYKPKLEIFGKFNEMGGTDKILNYSLDSLGSGQSW